MECGAFAVGPPGRAIAVVFQWVDSVRRDPSALDALIDPPPFLSSQVDPSASVQDEPCITRAWPMDVVAMGILVCYSGS